MSKKITFSEFRYHLLPLETIQVSLEFTPKLSYEELKDKKNELFKQILDHLHEDKTDKNLFKLIDSSEDVYLFKVSNKKYSKVVRNFEEEEIPNEPYVYVIIDNTPSIQKILISEDIDVFSSINVTKNILLKIFRKHLNLHGLNIETKEVFDKKTFWTLIKKYQGKITYVNIEVIKPNLANISKSLPIAFRDFVEKTNAHQSNILLKAPENGKLENISQNNKDLEGLVEYSSKGGGEIKIKVKGVRKQIKTSDDIKKVDIDQIDLEGAANQVIKMYKEIIK